MREALIATDEARRRVLSAARPLPPEPVAVGDALERVLAEDVRAATDVPGFANSAMDGYAVRACAGGSPLRVIGESRAGHPFDARIDAGEAVAISTGAALPDGADAVVPLEDAHEAAGTVTLAVEARAGLNVRRPGEDLRAGSVVLRAGTPLGPAELGVAVAAGAGSVLCARRPRVALLATGDELRAPGATLGRGQVHDSNAVTSAALVTRAGGEVVQAHRVGDDRSSTETALAGALGRADVVVVSGGVSVGRHDHVKAALYALDVQEGFWGVALKPGKPTWFGTRGERLVFGLPGNPVSSMATFVLFVRPALRALQGAPPDTGRGGAVLAAPIARSASREQAVRVALEQRDGTARARPTGPQGSHLLSSMLGADALALIPAGEGVCAVGDEVAIERL